MPQSFEARPHPPSTLSPRPPPPRYEDSSPGFEGSRKGRNEYLSPRDVLRDARTMRAEGMGALGLHAPRSDNARRRNPWGHADATFHKGAHNQAPAPSAGAFHRSQNAVIVDGVFDPLGQRQPPPSEREQLVELVARHSPIVPRQSLSTTQVLNSGPHLGGDTEAAAEEAWQIAQSTGANALGKGPDPEEEQRYRVRASPPTAKPARCGAGPGLVGEEVGVYGAGLAEQMMADSAAAARYQVERTASGPYHASRGLRRTSRPDVHFLASPRTGHPTPTDTSDRALQDLIHATASGMRAKGGEPAVAPLRVDSYWPNHKGVAAGHVPGGNNPMIGTGHQLDLSAMISREKKVPTLWGHGGRTDDVQKCQMASIRDVERYIASLRDKPPSPPPKKNLGGEPVAQMLPDYPLPPTLPAVTPAGCVNPSQLSKQPDDEADRKGDGLAGGTRVVDDNFRGGSATAAATRAAQAMAEAAQADAKLRDAQHYIAAHSHQIWDPSTGSYAARKGKELGQAVGHKLAPTSGIGGSGVARPNNNTSNTQRRPDATTDALSSSSLSYGGSRVVLSDKDIAPGMVAETTAGHYGSFAPSRGREEIRYSRTGHQTAATGAPTRSC